MAVAHDIALGARDAVTAVIPFIQQIEEGKSGRKEVVSHCKHGYPGTWLVSSLQSPATPSVYVLRLQWPGLLRVSLVGRFERT
ncbi:hypothetical protein E4U49_005941 [Claviceps purpurea]|nr:hypothetical protein E4U49_005941 [Claviceps purpurea]KAG6304513.1 hypothetical protein E4U45_001471 [Claviceps purpurea]